MDFCFSSLTLTPGTGWGRLESDLWNPCLFSYIRWQHQSNPCQPCPDPIAMGCVCIISFTLKCQVPLRRVFRLLGQKLEHAGILSTPNIVIHSWALLCWHAALSATSHQFRCCFPMLKEFKLSSQALFFFFFLHFHQSALAVCSGQCYPELGSYNLCFCMWVVTVGRLFGTCRNEEGKPEHSQE